MVKNNRGVTLVSLALTIIILLVLSTIIIRNTYIGQDYKNYKLMCADVELIHNKVLIYYKKFSQLPIIDLTENEEEAIEEALEGSNADDFAKVDISKLNGITLNFGAENDVFVLNKNTLKVYYLNGVEYEGEFYYTD